MNEEPCGKPQGINSHITNTTAVTLWQATRNPQVELFEMLKELVGCKLLYRSIDWRQSDQKIFVADNKKAQEYFNWYPKINKKEGISKMINWLEREQSTRDYIKNKTYP